MKTLIVYYTRTGSNQKVAERLREKLGCDIDRIQEEKEGKLEGLGMAKAAFQTLLKKKTKIKTEKNPAEYGLVIVVTPFWAGVIPPATRTYLTENREKIAKVALFSVSGRGRENRKALPDFEKTVGKKSTATRLLAQSEEVEEKLEGFIDEIR